MSKKITKEQWNVIEAPVKARMNCDCGPLCDLCKFAMYESQQIHTRYSRAKYPTTNPSSNISRSLMWYEVTFTYPDRDRERAIRSIEKLKKYSNYKYIDGRFEIGKKNALYHMHFLIKTNKYLRLREVKVCNANKVAHLARLKGKDGLKFQNYIEKDVEEKRPEGWDFNFSQ